METVVGINDHTVGVEIQFEVKRWFESRRAQGDNPEGANDALQPNSNILSKCKCSLDIP